jgi:hypothetical protein
MLRLCVAAEIPLSKPTVLIRPSWMPNTNSRTRIFRSISRFLPPSALRRGLSSRGTVRRLVPRPDH